MISVRKRDEQDYFMSGYKYVREVLEELKHLSQFENLRGEVVLNNRGSLSLYEVSFGKIKLIKRDYDEENDGRKVVPNDNS